MCEVALFVLPARAPWSETSISPAPLCLYVCELAEVARVSSCEREESSAAASVSWRLAERVGAGAEPHERLHCPELRAIEFRNCASSGKIPFASVAGAGSWLMLYACVCRVEKVFAFTVGCDVIHQWYQSLCFGFWPGSSTSVVLLVFWLDQVHQFWWPIRV